MKEVKLAEKPGNISIRDGVAKVEEINPSTTNVIERFYHTGDVTQLFVGNLECRQPEIKLDIKWINLSREAKINRIIKYTTDIKLQSCMINAMMSDRLKVDYDPVYCCIKSVTGLSGPDLNGKYCIKHDAIKRVVKRARLTFV